MNLNLNLCGEHCNNISNRQLGCEKILDDHMNLSKVKEKLCEFYEETIEKHKYNKIVSCTRIDGKRADEYFFGDIVGIFVGCFNFNVSIQTMYKATNLGFSKAIKKDVQDSVKKILFGQAGLMENIVKACKDVDGCYGTDIFSSIAVRIDSLYRYGI